MSKSGYLVDPMRTYAFLVVLCIFSSACGASNPVSQSDARTDVTRTDGKTDTVPGGDGARTDASAPAMDGAVAMDGFLASDAADVSPPVDAATEVRTDTAPPTDATVDVRTEALVPLLDAAPADTMPPTDATPDVPSPPIDAATGAPVDSGVPTPDAPPGGTLDAGSPDAPGNSIVDYRWVVLPQPLGTAISAVTMDSEGVLYAGAGGDSFFSNIPQAGIFKSTDEGASWRAVNRGVYDYHVGALAAVGTTIYAGTVNLLRSTDRGATWQQTTPAGGIGLMQYIGGQGEVVMAGSTYGGNAFQLSTNGGMTFTSSQFASGTVTGIQVLSAGSVVVRSGEEGIFRSTDRGATFSAVQGIANGFGLAAQLLCDGTSTCYAFAHTTADSFSRAVLVKSTDAGASWAPISPARLQEKVLAVSDQGTLYVSSGTRIARSDDGGATFVLINRPTPTGWYQPNCGGPFFARGNKIFAGCVNGVYRSDDKGQHWRPANGSPTTGAITGYPQRMFSDATPTSLGATGDIYVIGSDGSTNWQLRRSSDGGWTWTVAATSFYANSCLVTAAGAIECLGATIGSSQPTPLVRSEDHGITWRNIVLPPGPNQVTPFSALSLVGAGSVLYVGGANGIARSTDGGLTFPLIAGSPAVVALQALRSGNVVAAQDNGMGLRSTDQGATWHPISQAYGLPFVEEPNGRLIRAVQPGLVQVSTDEGVTWTHITSNGFPYSGLGVKIAALNNAGHLLVFGPGPTNNSAFGQPPQVYASSDGALTFAPMPAQIPNPNPIAFAKDKQGRLIVASSGGLFRLESVTDPGPSAPPGGVVPTPPAPRPLTMVIENAPWTLGSWTGFAVDSSQRLYRSDDNDVWLVEGGAASSYLTLADTTMGAGLRYSARFLDVDVGPDGQPYVLLSGGLMGVTTSTDLVVTSAGAHQAALLRALGGFTEGRMNVIGTGRVGYITRDGFSTATASSVQAVYTATALGWTSSCISRDLAIGPSGAVMFPAACIGRPVQRGTVDGATLGVLYQQNWDTSFGESIPCSARAPGGGFYALVTDTHNGGPRLIHLPEGTTSVAPLAQVPTEPSFGEVRVGRGGQTFGNCEMAVAPSGEIYVHTLKEVWKVGL